MNFYTPVEIPGSLPQLTHADRLMLFGSCFATHIGMRLTNAKFRCDVNPYGVLYNPLSISAALREIVEGKRYAQDDLFFFRECWQHGCKNRSIRDALWATAISSRRKNLPAGGWRLMK